MVHFNHDFGIGTRLISWHKPHTVAEIFLGYDVLFRNLVDIYIVVFVTGAIKFIKSNLDSRRSIEQLQSEMASVNYSSLKSKVDSDFILNALEEIIHQSKHNKDEAPDTIAQLSNVLDDALYGATEEKRSLQQEVKQLFSYLDLSAKINEWLEIKNMESQIGDPTLTITTRSVQELLQIILRSCAKKNQNISMDLIVLNEERKCIIQVTLAGNSIEPDFQSHLGEHLELYFPLKNELSLSIEENEINLLIKLAL